MQRPRLLFSRIRFVQLSLLVPVALLVAGMGRADEILPTYPGLEADVAFWERIFTKYGPSHCVFHDREDLNTIYGVVKLPNASPPAQSRLAARYLGILRKALDWLAQGGLPRNKLERIILESTPLERRIPAYFRAAQKQVRCQRGVDLKPSIERSRQHMAMVKRVLKQKRLPTDLAHLPHLESGYSTRARSSVGAVGLWQFMPATAREYGLRVSRRYDARTVPHDSTRAATNYLRDLYQRTGSWPLAITAYNYGPNGVLRAIKNFGPDYMRIRTQHRTKLFGFASRNYYPSFLAVRNIAERIVARRGDELAGD